MTDKDSAEVRCIHWRECGASPREDASNWCPHWGLHTLGGDENSPCNDDSDSCNAAFEGQATKARCEPLPLAEATAQELSDRGYLPTYYNAINGAAKIIRDAYTAQTAELATLQTIRDRAFDGDTNDLQNRMESREPLSLADQREVYEWLQEKEIILGDYDEKIVAREAELATAKAEVVALRERVAILESLGRIVLDERRWSACPVCRQDMGLQEHLPNCIVADVLKEGESLGLIVRGMSVARRDPREPAIRALTDQTKGGSDEQGS